MRLLEAVGTLSTRSHAFSISALVRPKSDFITINGVAFTNHLHLTSSEELPVHARLIVGSRSRTRKDSASAQLHKIQREV